MVIFLNGTSSVGKTTIARELQNILGDKWLYMDMDHFIEMLNPECVIISKTDHPKFLQKTSGFYVVKRKNGYHIDAGAIGSKVLHDMVDQVSNMADLGWNIVFAGVRPYAKQVMDIKKKLEKYNLFTVFIEVAEEILQQREKHRGDRLVSSAVELSKEFDCQHLHDLTINSSDKSSNFLSMEIIKHFDIKL